MSGRKSTTDKLALALSIFWLALIFDPGQANAQTDLPNPTSNFELIPAGSLVIPMDNSKQNIGAVFNLKAYGLVNNLLWDEIPVRWAIRAGKTKDGTDFTATAQRIFPTAQSAATYDFKAGPFIIHADWADYARTAIASFGNQVAVYELTQDATIDIRYNIKQKKKVATLDDGGNASIHNAILAEAGFVFGQMYDEISAATLLTINAGVCFTMASEPHFNDDDPVEQTEAIRAFMESGGNFLAQCAAIVAYENEPTYGHYLSTNGIEDNNTGSTILYDNADLAFSQYEGDLDDTGGSVTDFELAAGSNFQSTGHIHAYNTPETDIFVATGAKLTSGDGSMAFYLGGHDYGFGSIEALNGARMYLNAVMMPSGRPSACGFDFEDDPSALRSIEGRVYEDVNGDSNLGGDSGRPNVTVRVYRDLNNNGLVDGSDALMGEVPTDANGDFSVGVSNGVVNPHYLVAVDSRSVTPSAGYTGGFTQLDLWAQQTYGDDPTTATLDPGSRYGGRTPGVSDAFHPTVTSPASNNYQHLARVNVGAADVTGVDFGFSFNAVTNARGGDLDDDDLSAERTIQGSLRQFLQNANAIGGANTMRFVPAVTTNATGGGGQWWQVAVSEDLPEFLDSGTTVDGTAYSATDGTTVRNDNPGSLGSGGTVGTDGISLNTLGKPEFELVDANNLKVGLALLAANSTVRRLAIYGFGTAVNKEDEANIRVGIVSNALIEECVIGASAADFSNPGIGPTADNIRILDGDNGTIRNNLIGFSGGHGIGMKKDADGWLFEGNEIRANAWLNAELNGISFEECNGSTVRGNLIWENEGSGIDTPASAGSHNIVNNTVTRNGIGIIGNAETPGIRIFGINNTIDRNVLYENFGAGVMVTKDAQQNLITRNSIYHNGTILNNGGGAQSNQIGIDLLPGGDQRAGDYPFVTLNDPGDLDGNANGLLNFPIMTTATTVGPNLILTGFVRPGSAIEFFIADPDPFGLGQGKTYLVTLTEGSVADLDGTSGTYGPGTINNINQGTDTTSRYSFQIPVPPGVSQGTTLTATATLAGATSEFSGNVPMDGYRITGTVYEDINGDANLADAVAMTGVTVDLYLDGGDGLADGVDDGLVISQDTDGSGVFQFLSLAAGSYWLTVDSKDMSANGGLNGGAELRDIWAEQTYGPIGALQADGTGGTGVRTIPGPCYGGRLGGVSDDATSLASAQHVVQVVLSSSSATDLDFAFSFNVVTNTRGGDDFQDDGVGDRFIQGTLRQFLVNALSITGDNTMRFVPAVQTNQSGGGGQWWQVAVTKILPQFEDSGTTVDGTAYRLTDGTSQRNDNPGSLGSGGSVGVDGLSLATLDKPEFEIFDGDNINIGLDLQADDATVRRLAIYGFGDAENNDGEANIRVGQFMNTLIENCIIGTSAASFSNPSAGPTADNIRIVESGSGTIRNNLIGFSEGNGIGMKKITSNWLIEGNEIRANGLVKAELNGISLEDCIDTTVRGNLIWENDGAGIDTDASDGSHIIENNTVRRNGIGINGNVETPGIRIFGTNNKVDRNLLYENYGAGVLVTKDATQNTITRNSIYDNGTILNNGGAAQTNQIGIDLLDGGDERAGDFPFFTLNDLGDIDNNANGLLNFPVLESASLSGLRLIVTGYARPGSLVEIFIASADASGFGEGKTYVGSATEGSAGDLDNTTGSYGPGAVNGLVQGQDNTNRFRIEITLSGGVSDGALLTATATLAGATSEFSGLVTAGLKIPDLVLLKSVLCLSDPVNGGTNPKAIPGADMLYTVAVSNQGSGTVDADSLMVRDAVPVNSRFNLNDIDTPGSGPVLFEDGATTSDLTYTFTSLGSTTDDLAFSADNGVTFDYTPVPDAEGFDDQVTHIRVNPKGEMAASNGSNHPSFTLKFKTRVE